MVPQTDDSFQLWAPQHRDTAVWTPTEGAASVCFWAAEAQAFRSLYPLSSAWHCLEHSRRYTHDWGTNKNRLQLCMFLMLNINLSLGAIFSTFFFKFENPSVLAIRTYLKFWVGKHILWDFTKDLHFFLLRHFLDQCSEAQHSTILSQIILCCKRLSCALQDISSIPLSTCQTWVINPALRSNQQ